MTTITWHIEYMQTSAAKINGHSNVVLFISWRCNGTQDTFNGAVSGLCYLPIPTGAFTPYKDLTQDQVLGWCYANGVNQESVEAEVQAQLDKQVNPPTIQSPPPWNVA